MSCFICISSDVQRGETTSTSLPDRLPVAGPSRRRPSLQRFASRTALRRGDGGQGRAVCDAEEARHVTTRNLHPARHMAITCHRHIMCCLVCWTWACQSTAARAPLISPVSRYSDFITFYRQQQCAYCRHHNVKWTSCVFMLQLVSHKPRRLLSDSRVLNNNNGSTTKSFAVVRRFVDMVMWKCRKQIFKQHYLKCYVPVRSNGNVALSEQR